MYYVYILFSRSTDRFYTGQTEDVGKRFIRHNTGGVRSTKSGRPWMLVYAEKYKTRAEAVRREREIKSMKDRDYIIGLIDSYTN